MKSIISIQENYRKLEGCVLNILANRLPKNRFYHNSEHTIDVRDASKRLALLEGITPEDRIYWDIMTGALIHDVGHIFTYKDHEEAGARFAKELFSMCGIEGYRKKDINRVSRIILATKLPQSPQTLCEKIVCDADVDNFGRDDFFAKGNLIRKELEAQGITMSDEKWNKGTLDLLTNHDYFTGSAKKLRQEKKQENIKKLFKKVYS